MDQENKDGEDIKNSPLFYLKKTLEILDNMGGDINEPTRSLLKSLSRKIDEVLSSSTEPAESACNQALAVTRLNDLGLPMHPLEIEVDDMIEQAKQGRAVFPVYNRAVDETPLKYLEKHYGRYLKAFNQEENYLYQHQLQAIDPKFRNNLRTWLDRNGKNINDYIPTKSKLIDKEFELLKTINIEEVKNKKKLFNLIQAKNTQDT